MMKDDRPSRDYSDAIELCELAVAEIVSRSRQRLLYLALEAEMRRADQAYELAKSVRRSRRWRIATRIVSVFARITRESVRPTTLDQLIDLLGPGPVRLLDRKMTPAVPGVETISQPHLQKRDPARTESFPAACLRQSADSGMSAMEDGVSFVILNRNGECLLPDLLSSLAECDLPEKSEVILIDHGSSDDSIAVAESYAGRLPMVIRSYDRNFSYSFSNNNAARSARYPYLFFVNNDIRFADDSTVRKTLSALQIPGVGLVGLPLAYPGTVGRLQHAGIRFYRRPGDGFIRPRNLQPRNATTGKGFAMAVPAVTAAAVCCRKSDFLAVEGFCEGYNYGYEDVDLCLSFKSRLGLDAVVVGNTVAIHDESATQKRTHEDALRARRRQNLLLLQKRYGFGLRRRLRADRLRGEAFWTNGPVVIGFIVGSGTTEAARFSPGDLHQLAHTLIPGGHAVAVVLDGWGNVSLDYCLDGVDILCCFDPGYDLRRVCNVAPGLISVAIISANLEGWLRRAWVECYDFLLDAVAQSAGRCKDDWRRRDHDDRYWLDGELLQLRGDGGGGCTGTGLPRSASLPPCYYTKESACDVHSHPLRRSVLRVPVRDVDEQPLTANASRPDDGLGLRCGRVLHGALWGLAKDRFRFGIKIAAPRSDKASAWGDWYFAAAIATELKSLGHVARVDTVDEWYAPRSFDDDVVLVIRGLQRYRCRPDQLNILWNISHSDGLSVAEMSEFAHAFLASDRLVEAWRDQVQTSVSILQQFSDPYLFFPDNDEQVPSHDVLFVGSWRKTGRRIVSDALDAGLPLTVYGRGWEGKIPRRCLAGSYIENGKLRKYYSRAKIVLNDHAPAMIAADILNNRVFDVLFCGGLVVSDDLPAVRGLASERVAVYPGGSAALGEVVRLVLVNRGRGSPLHSAGLARLVAAHSVQARCRTLLAHVTRLAAGMPFV